MKHEQLQIYFVMGSVNVKESNLLNVLEDALKGGITMFQFREKGRGAKKGAEYESLARECQRLCQRYGVPFIVNDDVELALKLDTDGLHIGQEDGRVEKIRERIGSRWLGVSVHSRDEAEIAYHAKADYVGIGPVFGTQSKENAPPPAGTALIAETKVLFPDLPIVAIGGITASNAYIPLKAGADGVAVISALCESDNRKEHISKLKEIVIL
ncbi:thiamine phosphate synthase [Pradoshia eiseniae]|uniref:Thiamine-phosphate synthase n=1 Tax=Pradoshia eiseniae TaxID=2064768 RepID=A0A2S7N3T6_9BACI|nr:thiamine phosphate synthase [Pradoshia eiseniae]PQD96694.1 thiamine phosphate synthase [Pradoshia eiseniae]